VDAGGGVHRHELVELLLLQALLRLVREGAVLLGNLLGDLALLLGTTGGLAVVAVLLVVLGLLLFLALLSHDGLLVLGLTHQLAPHGFVN